MTRNGAPLRREAGSRSRRLAAVAGSALTAGIVFGALPAVMLVLVGNPLTHGLGHQGSHTSRLLITVLVVVIWVSWFACCAQLSRAVMVHVRLGTARAAAGAPLIEWIAVRIAGGILAITAFGVPLATSTTSGAALPAPTHVVVLSAAAPAAPPSAAPVPAAPSTYVVRAGDSLWSIADSQLGDGADWTELAALNLGHVMPDGRRFVDPSLIYAGWVLSLPEGAEAPVVLDVTPSADVTPPSGAAPRSDLPTPPPAVSEQMPAAAAPAHVRAEPAAHGSLTPVASPRASRDGTRRGSSDLPELFALGIGAIGAAALARRSRRHRALGRIRTDGSAHPIVPSTGAVDADTLLGRFAEIPALRAFEVANGILGMALTAAAQELGPRFRAICVGATGVDFWLEVKGQPAPGGLSSADDGASWHVGHEAIAIAGDGVPYLRVALPIGEDEAGTWLVPIQVGGCLALVGEAADALWRAARSVQESWAWADTVLVSDDPAIVERELALQPEDAAPGLDVVEILYFGSPAALAPSRRTRITMVTTSGVPVGDVAVLVDHRAASIHPLGRTLRPHLFNRAVAADVGELMSSLTEDMEAGDAGSGSSAGEGAREDDDLDSQGQHGHLDPQDSIGRLALEGPGLVEAKLLTPSPRLEGLREELPPNRARRATELVAYLALHHPDRVTSDRLRTRVLGNSDADAASKTLFNTATAARRAMGTDAAGNPLFPAGTRSGHYGVSAGVTTDVHRAADLATAGGAAEDPEVAMALLRASLTLVEGEPLANALSGYTWWESEGHGGRIAAVLVNAANNLAALAVEAGFFDLAQWGLAQARLVDPYSESLSRTAMQVAAAAGDDDRLRREWRECQRRVDELDPGSSPSPRTERLYGELSRGVLVGVTSSAATGTP